MKNILSLLIASSVFVAPFIICFLGVRCLHDRVAFSAVVILMFCFYSMQGMLEYLLTKNDQLKEKNKNLNSLMLQRPSH